MKKFIFLSFAFIYILKCNSQTITNYSTFDGLINDYVECVAVDNNDNIWFGTAAGISMFDGNNWTSYSQSSDPQMLSNDIKAITVASNGDVWVGTDYGANKLVLGSTGGTWTSHTILTGLANNKITSIDEAPNGNLWFSHSSFQAGVSMFDGNNWISYNSPDLPPSGVCETSFDANGDKWFASPLDGLVHFDGANFTQYTVADGLVSNYSTSICIDDYGHKWLGSGSGMSQLSNSVTLHTQMYLLPPPDTLNPVVDIVKDSYNRVWTTIYVGYLAVGGVAYWNGQQWNDFDQSDGIAGQNVRGLAIDSYNNVWIATSTGVSKILAIPNSIKNIIDLDSKIRYNTYEKKITLEINNKSLRSFNIYNNLGAKVFSSYDLSKTNFNISNLKKGVYYVSIGIGDSFVNKSIVIH